MWRKRARIPTLSTLSPPPRRLFSVHGDAAASLLARHTNSKVHSQNVVSSSEVGTTLAVLLHADRRPQQQFGFFGPSLLVCAAADLYRTEASGLGQGDLGIMQLQKQSPQQVQQVTIDLQHDGLTKEKAQQSLQRWTKSDQAAAALIGLWELFKSSEGIWFTLYLHLSPRGEVEISTPYLEFDDYAVHRLSEELQALYRARVRDRNTAQAEDGGLFYIKLPKKGTIGSFGYGAGNAMGTMDGLALVGGQPANFLDGGGGANLVNARLAIETLNRDPDVKSIFVNTFGGITQTDVVAQGIIDAVSENQMTQPIVVRVKGTGSEKAKETLRSSGIANFIIEDDFKTAARLAVVRGQAPTHER